MATSRSYNDSCGMAHALDLVGERWALLIVRELILGAKRYSDLRVELPGISTNVLSHRLDELERAGVVRRRKLAPPAGSWVYELTDWGQELEPIVKQLGRWGARSPSLPREAHLSVASAILSLRTNFDADAAGAFTGTFELRMGEEEFRATVAAGRLTVERGGAHRPDAVVGTNPGTLAALLYDGRDLADAMRAGELTVRGDVAAVERFLALFSLPAPMPPTASIMESQRATTQLS